MTSGEIIAYLREEAEKHAAAGTVGEWAQCLRGYADLIAAGPDRCFRAAEARDDAR